MQEVEWDNHSSELVESLTTFLQTGALNDVTLCSAEGKKIKAHRLILAATSTYFRVNKVIQLSVCLITLKKLIFTNSNTY